MYVKKNHELIQKVHEIDRTNLVTYVGRFMKQLEMFMTLS